MALGVLACRSLVHSAIGRALGMYGTKQELDGRPNERYHVDGSQVYFAIIALVERQLLFVPET